MNPIQKNIEGALELGSLPPEERQEIVLRVGAVIYQNVLMRAMEIMTEKDQGEFEKLLDESASPEEIFIFLKERVTDFEKIIEEEAIKFKDKSSNIMGQIGN